MPKILAIETATEACSAALINDEENATGTAPELFSEYALAPREHTKLILPMIKKVLKVGGCSMEDIDAIAFGRGPGAFTGLRIAAGIAQGLALSIDKPVIPVSTLSALALQAGQHDYHGETIIAGLDARMDEVYWGGFEYKENQLISLNEEKVTKMDEVGAYIQASESKHFLGIGSAWDAYALQGSVQSAVKEAEQTITVSQDAFPRATEIARLALHDFLLHKTVEIEEAQPVYLRNNVAKKSKKQPI